MEVVAADPAVSAQFSQALIDYAEEQVDQLTARLRADQMAGAMDSFEAAERRMLEAQSRSVDLKERVGVGSAIAEESLIYSQIGAIETEKRAEQARLDQLLANAASAGDARAGVRSQHRPPGRRTRRPALQPDRHRTRAMATSRAPPPSWRWRSRNWSRGSFCCSRPPSSSNWPGSRRTGRSATSRRPFPRSPPDEATYPRSFENTVLAFLIFAGIYLMVSLTAAILKEQVSG